MISESSTNLSGTPPSDETPKRRRSPSRAYLKFESVMKRSLDLVALQKPIEKIMAIAPDSKPLDLSDMTRAAVVLAVAAMDSYFTDVFAERFVPYLKKKGATKAMVTLLERAGLNTEYSLRLLAMKRPYRRIRTLIEAHLERTTTQKTAAIDNLFSAFGLKDFSENVKNLQRRKRLLVSIDNLVKRRNMIAHQGDTNSHGRLVPIDPEKTKRRLESVLVFVSGADELLHKQLAVRGA